MKYGKKLVVLGFAMLSLFGLTGCGKANVQLDLGKVKEMVDSLKSDEYSRASAVGAMLNLGIFGDQITDVYTLSDVNITTSNISNKDDMIDYSMGITEGDQTGFSYFVGKAAEGQKDALMKELDAYYEDAKKADKLLKTEVQGYLVYLVSEDNEQALKTLQEEGYQSLFPMMIDVTDETLENTLGIKKDDVEEYLVKTPMAIISSQSYMIIKPKSGKKDTIKKAMNTYMEKQEQQWSTYLADQYELVKNRKEAELGDYLIYIISEDNETVWKTIKNAQVK